MARYLAKWASVEALQFDGTRDSALAIAKAFPGRITRDLQRDDVFLALACNVFEDEALREVPTGSWLVRRSLMSSRLDLVEDRFFSPHYKRIDA